MNAAESNRDTILNQDSLFGGEQLQFAGPHLGIFSRLLAFLVRISYSVRRLWVGVSRWTVWEDAVIHLTSLHHPMMVHSALFPIVMRFFTNAVHLMHPIKCLRNWWFINCVFFAAIFSQDRRFILNRTAYTVQYTGVYCIYIYYSVMFSRPWSRTRFKWNLSSIEFNVFRAFLGPESWSN